MKKKNGFTLVELIGVIVILSILIVMLVPTINRVTGNSKTTLRESKINTIVTAGEEYGNEIINKYQNCIGEGASELAECTVPISTLIANGYIESEDDDNHIIDPITNSPMEGEVLLCYNTNEVSVYGLYIENEHQYSCSEFSVTGKNSLNLSSIAGVGYVGGNKIDVNIIKSGTFEGGFRCQSPNEALAKCRVNGNILEITPTKNQFSEEYREVPITLTGSYEGGQTLEKTYTLKVYPTSLSIKDPALSDSSSACLPIASTDILELEKLNEGDLSVTSTDENILEGTAKEGVLYIASKNKTGEATLTLKESHGNNRATLTRKIYELKVDTENHSLPENLVINSTKVIPIIYRSTGTLTITSTNPNVVHFSSPSNSEAEEITLNGTDNEFTIIAKDSGEAKIQIRGSDCGLIESDFSVSNLALESSKGSVYTGGEMLKTEIITTDTSGLTCSSSDPDAATCEVHATTLEIYPGSKANGDVALTISGPAGIVRYHLTVLPTSIELVDASGNRVDKVCTERGSGKNDKLLYARGTNLGDTIIDDLGVWELADATIAKEGATRPITVENRNIEYGYGREPFHDGFNGGVSRITIKERNGNKTASFDYHIYDLDVEENSRAIKIDETVTLSVQSLATGEISATSNNPRVASVSVEGSGRYSYEVNAVNERTVKITGESTGTAVITIKGSDCGEKKISIAVSGKTLSINLEPGTYTSSVGSSTLSCVTTGILRSCEVTFPAINTTSEYNVVGYSETKDSVTAQYKPGDKITLNYSNSGKTYYGNSADTANPVCTFTSPSSNMIVGSTSYFDMTCIDTGSGIQDGTLETKDFVTKPTGVGEIVSVSSPTAIDKGYAYKVGVKGTKTGLLNISLNAYALQDKFGNGNASTTLSNLFAAEYPAEATWSIGKTNRDDVIAVLYDNRDIDEELPSGYTLKFYGSGDMLDFMSIDYPYQSPWYTDFHSLITNAEFTSGITNVGDYVLYNASNLKTLILSDTLTKIGTRSFANADIYSLSIPDSIVSIGSYAFYNNSNLTELNLSNKLESIGAYSFYDHSLSSLEIPNSVTSIEEFAFANGASGRMNLSDLSFAADSKLQSIGNGAFQYHSLSTLFVPTSLKSIGDGAFSQFDLNEHSTLKSIYFADGSNLITIGDEAFYQAKLESLTLPAKVESIGRLAFGALRSGIDSLYIPSSIKYLGEQFAYGESLKEFIVDSENGAYTSVDGVIYSKDLSTLVKCPDNYYEVGDTLDIPENTKVIAKGAFVGWLATDRDIRGLTINLPSGIENLNIDDNFILFAINSINIENNDTYTTEDGILFDKDKTTIYRLPTYYDIENYTIPNMVKSISQDFAYANVKVKKVTIPESVTSIGSYAFQTDATYGLDTIDLYANEDVTFDLTSFGLLSFGTTAIADQSRTINLKSSKLKSRVDETYAASPFNITTNLES